MDSSVFKIEKYGSQVLRTPSANVKKIDKEIEKLVKKMLKTMYKANGVGLAAPQIGVNKRVVVIDVDYASERYEETIPNQKHSEEDDYNPIVMINPVIVHHEGEIDSYEGCLSFPEVFFHVKRARKITFKFQDLSGKEIRMTAENDLFCRCVQHEIDHLNGRLFVDLAIDKLESQKALSEHGLADIVSPPPVFMPQF